MRLQGGSLYLIAELDTGVMGCVVRRMWWKPWRWSVHPMYYEEMETKTGRSVYEVREGVAIKDLTMLGAIGILKLYGVRHRDFE